MQRHTAPLSQVDYPRMVEGGLDGGFWAIYTAQGPLDAGRNERGARCRPAPRRGDPGDGCRRTARISRWRSRRRTRRRSTRAGKKIVYQSIENAYPLANDVTLLRSFYALGVRLCGFAHFKVNQFADSATDAPQWKGLSPAGHDLLALMNELGIVPDHSHSSDDVFDQLVTLSKTPILLSHSGCRAVHDHPRNLDDARLKTLADTGGVIQINSLSGYLIDTPKDEDARGGRQGTIYGKLRTLCRP